MRRLHDELADGDALGGGEVDSARVLHGPARRGELAVDLDPGFRLGGQVCELAVRHGRIFAQNDRWASVGGLAHAAGDEIFGV